MNGTAATNGVDRPGRDVKVAVGGFRRRALLVASVVLWLPWLSACYSPYSFSSNAADILDGVFWGNPEHRIVFRKITAQEQAEEVFEFKNPPPHRRIVFAAVFMDIDDAKKLADHDARIVVQINLKHGGEVTTFTMNVAEKLLEDHPGAVRQTWIRPPDGWCDRPKGRVVELSEMVRGREHLTDTRRQWLLGPSGDGHSIINHGGIEFQSRSYSMRIRVEVAAPMDEPVSFYPVLAGGFPGNL